jgi:hypothetical protein
MNLKQMNGLFKKLVEHKYLYLIIIIVILISIFVIGNTNSGKKILEGLENKDDDSGKSTGTKLSNYSSDIKKNNEFMNDTLLMPKYNKDFQDFIIKLEEYSNNLMVYKLFSVAEQSSKYKLEDNDSMNKFVIGEMEKVNSIKGFIDSLNSSMKYIDRKKN